MIAPFCLEHLLVPCFCATVRRKLSTGRSLTARNIGADKPARKSRDSNVSLLGDAGEGAGMSLADIYDCLSSLNSSLTVLSAYELLDAPANSVPSLKRLVGIKRPSMVLVLSR